MSEDKGNNKVATTGQDVVSPDVQADGKTIHQMKLEAGISDSIQCWFFWFPIMNLARSFLYDVPMILSTPIKQQMGVSDRNIQLLYSAFYLPPIFTNLPYGALQKKIGPKCCYIALATMILGQALFWLGLAISSYWCLFFGRIFIGAGGEGTLISQVYTIKWYHYKPNITTMISCCKFCARLA